MRNIVETILERRSVRRYERMAIEEEKKQLTQQEKSGNYQAQGGFNFAPAQPDEQKEPVLRYEQKISW